MYKTLGIAIGTLVGTLVVLHFAVFGPLYDSYNSYREEIERKTREIHTHLEQLNVDVGPEFKTSGSLANLVRRFDNLQDNFRAAYTSLEESLVLGRPEYAQQDLRQLLLEKLAALREREAQSEHTEILVTQTWGLDRSVVASNWGNALNLTEGDYRVFLTQNKMFPAQGTVEFHVNTSAWGDIIAQAREDRTRAGTPLVLFQAAGPTGQLEMEHPESQNDDPTPTNYQNFIEVALVGNRLVYSIRTGGQTGGRGAGDFEVAVEVNSIPNWTTNDWHHVAVTWGPNEADCRFFINGQDIGRTVARRPGGVGRRAGVGQDGAAGPQRDGIRISNLHVFSLGAAWDGSNAITCAIDNLHTSNIARESVIPPSPGQAPRQDQHSLFIRTFENPFLPPGEVADIYNDAKNLTLLASARETSPNAKLQFRYEVSVLRNSMGMIPSLLESQPELIKTIRYLQLLDFLHQNMPSVSMDQFSNILQIGIEQDPRGLESLVTFMDQVLEICDLCIERRVRQIRSIEFAGRSNEPSDDKMFAEFVAAIRSLREQYPEVTQVWDDPRLERNPSLVNSIAGRTQARPLGLEGGLQQQARLEMEGGGMGMPMGIPAIPDTSPQATRDRTRLVRWHLARKKGEVPNDFRNQYIQREESQRLARVYARLSLVLNATSKPEQMADIMQVLEYGMPGEQSNRLRNFSWVNIRAEQDGFINFALKLETHFLRPIITNQT